MCWYTISLANIFGSVIGNQSCIIMCDFQANILSQNVLKQHTFEEKKKRINEGMNEVTNKKEHFYFRARYKIIESNGKNSVFSVFSKNNEQ